MRFITCAGYYATGSSSITDFFSEFDNVFTPSAYEYRFVQDPDTIADLEYNILENNHRHNTSHAIKRFKRFTRRAMGIAYTGNYKTFGDSFIKLSDEYISKITQLKTKSWWHQDRIDKGLIFTVLDMGYSYVRRLLSGGLNTEKRYSLLRNKEYGYYTAISEEEFLNATKEYIDALFMSINSLNMPFVMVDQLVPPTNVNRYLRYFNDIKVIVIDRDPRDVFLVEKEKIQRGVIPVDNVKDYVEWFKITRKYSYDRDEDKERVLRLRFEDFVYNYDKICNLLYDFVEISPAHHKDKLKKFIPDKSKQNTDLGRKIRGYDKEIRYIENNLRDYLFDFGTV